jgi:hypothetical protein
MRVKQGGRKVLIGDAIENIQDESAEASISTWRDKHVKHRRQPKDEKEDSLKKKSNLN